jgi:hypothetical protein
MQTPTLAFAAAMVVLSLIYWMRTPAPGAHTEAGRSTVGAVPGRPAAGSPGRVTGPQGEPGTTLDASLREPSHTALCEIPGGRAMIHWREYLEFRQAADARAQSGQAIAR